MIRLINGDILECTEDIIGHQVNCRGVMGAGLAKQIRTKYPIVYKKYKDLCNKHQDDKLLGGQQYVDVGNGKTVANLFGQLNYGRNQKQTNYKALEMALRGLKYTVMSEYCEHYQKSIALPYGIGCGLAGGEWMTVYNMIAEVFSDYSITLYKL